jgi:hypothetical protein
MSDLLAESRALILPNDNYCGMCGFRVIWSFEKRLKTTTLEALGHPARGLMTSDAFQL